MPVPLHNCFDVALTYPVYVDFIFGMFFLQDTSIAMPVPLYHCFGMVLGSLSMFVHGARLVLPSAAFEADKCLKAVQQEK